MAGLSASLRVPRRVAGCKIPCQSSKLFFPILVLTVAYLITRTLALKGLSHPAAQNSWLTVVRAWPSLRLFCLKFLVWPGAMAAFTKELEPNPGQQAAAHQAAEIQRQIVGK